MTLKPLIKFVLPLLILAISIGSFQYLKSSKTERKKPQAKEKVWLVNALPAQLENLAADLSLYATIESPDLQTASSPAAAIVEDVHVKDGQHVSKGDLLITLDPKDFINSVNQAKADILDIKAQIKQLELTQQSNKKSLALEQDLLALSQAELNRVKRLKQSGLGSDSVLTDAKSALAKQQLSVLNKSNQVLQFEPKQQQLKAKLLRLESIRSQAELTLQRSTLKADFDGTVVNVDVAKGDRVKTAQSLLSLYPNNELVAKTRIPARYQPEIQAMLEKGIDIKASTYLSDQPIDMLLDRFSGQATTNGIEVYFKVTNGQQFLRLGNFLNVKVHREKQENLVKIPLQALYGTSRIYLVVDNRLQGLDVSTVGYYEDANKQKFALIKHPELTNDSLISTTHLPNAITGLKVKISEK